VARGGARRARVPLPGASQRHRQRRRRRRGATHPQLASACKPNVFPLALLPATELDVGVPGAPHSRMEKAAVTRSRESGGKPAAAATSPAASARRRK